MIYDSLRLFFIDKLHLELTKFIEVVKNTPLIAIDLFIIRDKKLLLGKRKNPPGKNQYFVPGGRIKKNQHIFEALQKILSIETNMIFKSEDNNAFFLGFDEHFYENNFLNHKKFDTHYIVLMFGIKFENLQPINNKISLNEQHDEFIWLDVRKDLEITNEMNKYMKGYLKRNEIKNLLT